MTPSFIKVYLVSESGYHSLFPFIPVLCEQGAFRLVTSPSTRNYCSKNFSIFRNEMTVVYRNRGKENKRKSKNAKKH